MAKYSETETTIDLGTVDLPEGTTDIVLMGLAELPNSGCRSEFVIELPDGATYSVAGEQGLRLPKAVSGEARIGQGCLAIPFQALSSGREHRLSAARWP